MVKEAYLDFFNITSFKKVIYHSLDTYPSVLDCISCVSLLSLRPIRSNPFAHDFHLPQGWAKPLLHLEDVEEAFDLAAEIVVRVRRELDKQNGGKTQQLRLTDGAAREFLHQVQVRPQEDLDAFVHG